ncbi:MAG TPA: DUF503 domain-containing protein [Dehalococcoidia bacterium]|nr:DUF503 domain-containing protein [Dehalococcoidia bacterium]
MSIGALWVRLRLPENGSLKGKRKVLKSITSRVGNKFNVAIAEVQDHDLWQLATLGVVCVSNDGRHANELLSKVMDFIGSVRGDAEILDYRIEILHAF